MLSGPFCLLTVLPSVSIFISRPLTRTQTYNFLKFEQLTLEITAYVLLSNTATCFSSVITSPRFTSSYTLVMKSKKRNRLQNVATYGEYYQNGSKRSRKFINLPYDSEH